MRTASIAGPWPRTTNRRPPGRSHCRNRAGTVATAAVTQTASNRRSPASYCSASATSMRTLLPRPVASSRARALAASSGTRSMLTTSRPSAPRQALM